MMANILPFLVMTELQAARFREITANNEARLDPRKIDAGPHIGKYALPRRVMTDPAFADHHDLFDMLTEVAIDAELAWPVPPEFQRAVATN